jgi:hypothetical protein
MSESPPLTPFILNTDLDIIIRAYKAMPGLHPVLRWFLYKLLESKILYFIPSEQISLYRELSRDSLTDVYAYLMCPDPTRNMRYRFLVGITSFCISPKACDHCVSCNLHHPNNVRDPPAT